MGNYLFQFIVSDHREQTVVLLSMVCQSIMTIDIVVEELLDTWQLGIGAETDSDEGTSILHEYVFSCALPPARPHLLKSPLPP